MYIFPSSVSAYLIQRGWQRIYDKNRDDYKLRWCETKSMTAYNSFKEGEQLIYQIPNNKVLTTKIGLLNSLREYERVINKVRTGKATKLLKLEDFFPETYRMDIKEERQYFFAIYKEKQLWICKPTGLNQGRGIFLLKSPEDVAAFRANLQSIDDNPLYKKQPFRSPQARVMQRYIHNPLLLEGKKFDVRSYFLIASTIPYILLFRHGYIRLTCNVYDPRSDDLTAHLTNQYMQKRNPLYNEVKEETVWSMERFNEYINEKFTAAKNLPKDWVFTVFTKRMQQIMMQCFLAVKSKLDCKLGYFDLIGCDFLIDEDFKVWFLEMNCNPALHTNCDVLKEVIPTVVNETLDLTLEIFNKSRKGMKITPLQSLSSFVILHNGDPTEQTEKPLRSRTPAVKSPQKMQRCKSATQQAHVSSKVAEKILKTMSPTEYPRTGALPVSSSSVPKLSERAVLSMTQRHVSLGQNLPVPYTVKLKVKNDLPFSGRSARQSTDETVFAEHNPDSGLSMPKTMTTMSMPVLNEKSYLSPRPQRTAGYRTQSTGNASLNTYFINSPHIKPLQLQTRTSDQRMKSYKANESTYNSRDSLCEETEACISNSEKGQSAVTAKVEKNVSFAEESLKLSDYEQQHKTLPSDRGA
ncbi:inactive polyglycylase TTLL10 [Protopterus annectens]|uniref:inactive polyglycylase TTLL10 n=1 Tax=Protopterus annectens TaxID=7888 RepID=UPI001CFBE00A|nr:inactive polyglycylase TTLL10 [Protopterus annectens]